MTETEALRILHLTRDCSPEQVRRAYRDLVKVWHPDRFPTDARLRNKADRTMQELNEAYRTLQGKSNAEPRAQATAPEPRPSTPGADRTPRGSRGWTGLSRPFHFGIGSGIATGAAVGILVAVGASLWTGTPQPAAPVDESAGAVINTPASPAPGRQPVHTGPQSGTDLVPATRTGSGVLVLQNTGPLDGAVILAEGAVHARALYVRAGEQVTVLNVAAGTYRVLIMIGRDWSRDHFTNEDVYQQLDRTIEFMERNAGAGTERTRLTVSFQPVVADRSGVRTTEPFRLVLKTN